MLVKVYASGTNVQRLAKGAHKVDGVVYASYSQLEAAGGVVKRKFFASNVSELKTAVEAELDEQIQPSWNKVWAKPDRNRVFIESLFIGLVGDNEMRPEINLSAMTEEMIDCFMINVSANNKEMSKVKEIVSKVLPQWHVTVLNGDYTSNKQAEFQVTKETNQAKIADKKGVIVIANQMGSRSFSIPAIQANVIAFDRGSVDATTQKVSRCLTPGLKYNGEEKDYGYIIDFSFDPNRSENIEEVLLQEVIQVQKSNESNFADAVRFVFNNVNMFRYAKYGEFTQVTETDMFAILGDNENLLRVADVTVDAAAAIESGVFDILASVTSAGKSDKKKKEAINAKTGFKEGGTKGDKTATDKDKRSIEKIINEAIRSLNMSATSVYDLANEGDSYRECIEAIAEYEDLGDEFEALFGVQAEQVLHLLDEAVLNEPVLDVVVQNSKVVDSAFV
jgi:hypothetical protein